jgi:hypothetical protein
MKPNPDIRRRFIAAESDSLTIETIQEIDKGCNRLRLLKLKGTWRANQYNELVFEAVGHKGKPERFTFRGAWKVNRNQQVEYTFEDGRGIVVFNGYWDFPSRNRLVYILEGSSTSRFEFRVQLESANLRPKQGQIRFRIGIGLRSSRLTKPGRLLILYGEWKISRNLSLSFRMDYGNKTVRAIEFGAKVAFGRNDLSFAVLSESGKPLGITLTMTHKFLKSLNAKAFLRLKSCQKEQGLEAGFSLPF